MKEIDEQSRDLKAEFSSLSSIASNVYSSTDRIEEIVPSKNIYHKKKRAEEEEIMVLEEMEAVIKYYNRIIQMCNDAISTSVNFARN